MGEQRKEHVEISKVYKDERGTEIEIKAKAECSNQDEMRETLNFTAQSAHSFYLEFGKVISNML